MGNMLELGKVSEEGSRDKEPVARITFWSKGND